jgi:hypothetical protein
VLAVAGLAVGPIREALRRDAVGLPGRSVVVIMVDNRMASGHRLLAENSRPAFLSTRPVADCRQRGCVARGGERIPSGTLLSATCVVHGEAVANASTDVPPAGDNPFTVDSDLWYRVKLPDGKPGYLPEALVVESERGGAGLAACEASGRP